MLSGKPGTHPKCDFRPNGQAAILFSRWPPSFVARQVLATLPSCSSIEHGCTLMANDGRTWTKWFIKNFTKYQGKAYANMKKILFCLILLSACKPTSYFISANQVSKKKVILVLKNQVKIPGEISLSFETDFNAQVPSKRFISFIPEGTSEMENIDLDVIVGYSIGADFFALKQIDINLDKTYRVLFVKRLTSEDSKIQLYELYESGLGNYSGETRYSYYLSFPTFEPLQTMNTRSSSLFPQFSEKMSDFVSDCPALARKIILKENGYSLPQMSFNAKKQPEVLLRIIKEYNQCQ